MSARIEAQRGRQGFRLHHGLGIGARLVLAQERPADPLDHRGLVGGDRLYGQRRRANSSVAGPPVARSLYQRPLAPRNERTKTASPATTTQITTAFSGCSSVRMLTSCTSRKAPSVAASNVAISRLLRWGLDQCSDERRGHQGQAPVGPRPLPRSSTPRRTGARLGAASTWRLPCPSPPRPISRAVSSSARRPPPALRPDGLAHRRCARPAPSSPTPSQP